MLFICYSVDHIMPNYVRTFQVSFKFDVLFLSLAQFNLQVWGTHTFFHEFEDPGIQDDNIILLFM